MTRRKGRQCGVWHFILGPTEWGAPLSWEGLLSRSSCLSEEGRLSDSGQGPSWRWLLAACVSSSGRHTTPETAGEGKKSSCLVHYPQDVVLENKRARALGCFLDHSRLRSPSHPDLPLTTVCLIWVLKGSFLLLESFHPPDKSQGKQF